MPIALRFHLEQMEELATQIKRSPIRIRLQQVGAMESLIQEIESTTLYPLDYVVFRITGYRIESDQYPMLLGMVLLGDLVAMIAVVSKTMNLPSEGMLTAKEVASELGVSQRTVNRLKHEGLSFRWVTEPNGRARLGCSSHVLYSFRKRHESRIVQASSFSRLTPKERHQVVQLASEYRGTGRSLNDIAKEISIETKRGHETIRMLLMEDNQSTDALPKSSPLTVQDARAIEQLKKSGESWISLQAKYQKTPNAMRSAVARLRANRLKRLSINFIEYELFRRSDALDVILSPEIVYRCSVPILTLNPLQIDESQVSLTDQEETSIVSAMYLLNFKSSKLIQSFRYSPSERILDQVETYLRWSHLLQQRLILSAMPTSLAVATQHAGRPLQELPVNQLRTLTELVISTIGEVCGSLDVVANQTAVKTSASVLDRTFTVSPIKGLLKRASARGAEQEFSCPFHQVVSWGYLLPTTNIPRILSEEGHEIAARAASLKFGWESHPHTNQEIASELCKSLVWVKRTLSKWY